MKAKANIYIHPGRTCWQFRGASVLWPMCGHHQAYGFNPRLPPHLSTRSGLSVMEVATVKRHEPMWWHVGQESK